MPRGSEHFVVPGDKLGVIEEYIAGLGTYVADGEIYSAGTGYVVLDRKNKVASVRLRTRLPPIPSVGDVIIGQVTQVQEKTATVKILRVGDESNTGSFSGIVHISNVSPNYIRSMHRAFKPGDHVRAEVISTRNRTFHLSTENEKLGAVQAFCSHCGRVMALTGRWLTCHSCGSREDRKIAIDYGKVSA